MPDASDLQRQLIAMNSLRMSSEGGEGDGGEAIDVGMGGIVRDVNFGQSLKMPGLNSSFVLRPGQPARGKALALAKLLAQMGFTREKMLQAMKDIAGGAHVIYDGEGQIGHGLNQGSSFASMVGSSHHDVEIG